MLVRHRTDSPWRTWGSVPGIRLPADYQALKARFTSDAISFIIRAMPQSLNKIILHIIFSTKNRESWLESHVRARAHAYLATISRDPGAELVHVGGVADHVHIITTLSRTRSQAQIDRADKENVLKVIAEHTSASPR